ncbi:hypothetical protein HYFRA_00012037 [Hymenoscyphus fraxineus]|uniref:Uncharacterized protein n=1 Tax=Hymenoscyphus fraxineus TaxID=746836 RepID=A0A9N9PUE6_9HELO|nr:hypothetical protein HYFRA_00012037 [Hymenoscyphus fraxineus]
MCKYAQRKHEKCGCTTHQVIKKCFEARVNDSNCPVDGKEEFLTRKSCTVCGFHAEDLAEEDLVKAGFKFGFEGKRIRMMKLQREKQLRINEILAKNNEKERPDTERGRKMQRERLDKMECD